MRISDWSSDVCSSDLHSLLQPLWGQPLWGQPLRSQPVWRHACRLTLLALFLVLWSAPAAASDLHPVRHGEGRLWRIERGDAPPSHIMGTIHITEIGRAHV